MVATGIGCLDSPGKPRPSAGAKANSTQGPRPGGSAAGATGDSTAYQGGLLGSRHDFGEGGADARVLCLTCHTPQEAAGVAPAIDRASRELVLAQAGDRALDRHSLICLSCHDGVIATDVFTSSHALAFTDRAVPIAAVRPRAVGGGDGQDDNGDSAAPRSAPLAGHPIGGLYPADARRYRPAADVTRDGRVRLPGGRVQCVSCHDPHNTARHPSMLVKSNERSHLCLSCHRL